MRKLTEREKNYNLKRSDDALQKLSDKKSKKRNLETVSYHSKIIDALKTGSGDYYNIKNVFAKVHIPTNFSLITHPKESLATICKLANTARSGLKIKHYKFDHSNMETMDLSAECVLDLVATEIRREHRDKKLRFGGVYPQKKSLQRLLRGIGIIKHLKVKHEYLNQSQMEKIEVFEGRSKKGDTAKPGALSDAELEAKNLVDHINKCLSKTKRKLTEKAVQRLSTYAGEIMGNANEHSETHSWFIKGYYDHNCDPYYCEIAIFNFGKTIAETFSDIDEYSYAYKKIAPYLRKHSNKFSSKWEKEDLVTVMSLQRGVSSKNQSEKDTRGMGTMEMIEFFDKMAQECSTIHKPEMAILSGSTHIRFGGKYLLSEDITRSGIIAFNDANDLNLPPNSDYISNIKPLYFPGSVISIRFPFSENQSLSISHD